MNKILSLILITFPLLFTACPRDEMYYEEENTPVDPGIPEEETPPVETPPVNPPISEENDELSIEFQAESPVDGLDTLTAVRGSYCNQTMCVDKIGLPDLIEGVDYQEVEACAAIIIDTQEGQALSSISASVVDANGQDLNYVLESPIGGSQYYPEAEGFIFFPRETCENLSGEFVLSVFLTFEEGGDVSYFLPITWREF